jgi:hypothetical protein
MKTKLVAVAALATQGVSAAVVKRQGSSANNLSSQASQGTTSASADSTTTLYSTTVIITETDYTTVSVTAAPAIDSTSTVHITLTPTITKTTSSTDAPAASSPSDSASIKSPSGCTPSPTTQPIATGTNSDGVYAPVTASNICPLSASVTGAPMTTVEVTTGGNYSTYITYNPKPPASSLSIEITSVVSPNASSSAPAPPTQTSTLASSSAAIVPSPPESPTPLPSTFILASSTSSSKLFVPGLSWPTASGGTTSAPPAPTSMAPTSTSSTHSPEVVVIPVTTTFPATKCAIEPTTSPILPRDPRFDGFNPKPYHEGTGPVERRNMPPLHIQNHVDVSLGPTKDGTGDKQAAEVRRDSSSSSIPTLTRKSESASNTPKLSPMPTSKPSSTSSKPTSSNSLVKTMTIGPDPHCSFYPLPGCQKSAITTTITETPKPKKTGYCAFPYPGVQHGLGC